MLAKSLPVQLLVSMAGIKVLFKALGPWNAVRVVTRVALAKARGEPWPGEPSPTDPKEAGSRAQAGDAILVYRALLEVTSKHVALDVAKSVVLAGALSFLDRVLPRVDARRLEKAAPAVRDGVLSKLVDRFPNSDWRLVESTPERFRFHVIRCRLVELVVEAGHPELATAFCSGDLTYFEVRQPDVSLERPTTIAGGHARCDFTFRLAG
ncbi:MAG: hypothetical protein Kow0069_27960 [Promethearchaeota archaeon]